MSWIVHPNDDEKLINLRNIRDIDKGHTSITLKRDITTERYYGADIHIYFESESELEEYWVLLKLHLEALEA